ncbi:hypothetical protein RRG08_018753 [Elysia crispata]|uniref:Uncharacterized protein n=1 Tax=Elysia crispata TaxID=231223 RepID=A0AAE1DA72_9GAST|nr:hypothetical protein RRG08_018753 [Elysia crispata]
MKTRDIVCAKKCFYTRQILRSGLSGTGCSIVEQKFLEKGHTYMECDSVHCAIERAVLGSEIFVSSDYVRKTKSARLRGEPYNVRYVDNSLFKDFSKVSNLTTIRPGSKAGNSQVMEIPCLRWLDHILQTGAWGITNGKTSLVKGVKRMDKI